MIARHAEDISWSDPFAAVRTVYEKPGRLRGECRHGWPPALGLAGAGASRAPAASHSLRESLPPFRPSAHACLMRPSPADATRAQVRTVYKKSGKSLSVHPH